MARSGSVEEARLKQRKLMEMARARHREWDVIARECGYKNGTSARAMYYQLLRENQATSIEETRTELLDSLDAMAQTYYPRARKGDTKALEGWLKIIERMAKFGGLDAPAKVEHSGEILTPTQLADSLSVYLQAYDDAKNAKQEANT